MQRARLGGVGAAALAVAGLLAAGSPARADFNFSDFASIPPSLSLVGNPNAPAQVAGNVLRMTTSATNQAAAAWFTTKQDVAGGFTTTFRFQVSGGTAIPLAVPSDTGADGVAFVIQNVGTTQVGANGGGIGYAGIANSLAVEADTFFNTNVTVLGLPALTSNGDPNGNHVSIQSNGNAANSDNITASKGISTLIPDLSDGAAHTVRVSYVPGTMSVYVDDLTTPRLTTPIDLSTLLNLSSGQAFVGLTSATGQAAENHDVLSWSFSSVPEPGSAAAALLFVRALGRRRRGLT
jgi:hypothetical protein